MNFSLCKFKRFAAMQMGIVRPPTTQLVSSKMDAACEICHNVITSNFKPSFMEGNSINPKRLEGKSIEMNL